MLNCMQSSNHVTDSVLDRINPMEWLCYDLDILVMRYLIRQ